MKRWVILAVLAVVVSSAVTVALQLTSESASPGLGVSFPVGVSAKGPKATGPQPKAVVEGDLTHHFGLLPQHATGKHSWVVRNEGAAELTLWMISSTCSCTLAKFKNGEKAVVKPGEATEIDLEYETRDNNGNYEKGAEIGTNDPSLPQFSLHVRGQVFPAVQTYPPGSVANFMGISNDKEDHVAFVAVFSKDRPELKILKTKTSRPDDISVDFEPLPAKEAKQIAGIDKGGYKVNVHVKSSLPLGTFREEAVITTDHPKQPELRLTIVGKMSGPINLLPESLQLHQVNGRAGAQGDLIVSVRGNRETKIEVAEVPKGLKAEIGPVENPAARKGRYRLRVTVPPGTPAQEIEGEVVLKTDHPKAGRVAVPVSIWVQNAP